ncbi:MAG TPA: hypothetical protein VGO22_07520 [Pseudorhizobium sp.]|nr:hypothetical protein [Pseudorhizobium sp.]
MKARTRGNHIVAGGETVQAPGAGIPLVEIAEHHQRPLLLQHIGMVDDELGLPVAPLPAKPEVHSNQPKITAAITELGDDCTPRLIDGWECYACALIEGHILAYEEHVASPGYSVLRLLQPHRGISTAFPPPVVATQTGNFSTRLLNGDDGWRDFRDYTQIALRLFPPVRAQAPPNIVRANSDHLAVVLI